MFRNMAGGCAHRSPANRCFAPARRPTCQPIDWRHAFACGTGCISPADSSAPRHAAPFPAFLGALAEAFGGSGTARRRRSERDTARRSFRREVEQKLEALLPTGEVGMDRIARGLGCSRQTLYRRLKEEGTTYEQVLDSLRRRLALRYIERDGLGVKQTAYLLGFSEPASFSRAFKRWTGRSPGRR